MIEGECANRDHKEGAPKLTLIPYFLLGACTGNPDGNNMSVVGNISGKSGGCGGHRVVVWLKWWWKVLVVMRPHSHAIAASHAAATGVSVEVGVSGWAMCDGM